MAAAELSEHTYKFNVKVKREYNNRLAQWRVYKTSSSCSGAVTRILEKAKPDGESKQEFVTHR